MNPNMPKPLVSVGLPVYNGEKWVENAILTLANQTYENLEIIVIDDCSTDNSLRICEEMAEKHQRISVYRNDTNLGAENNFRKTLSLGSGEFFVWACQDDYWDKNFIALLVSKLESNQNAVLASGAVQLVDTKDKEDKLLQFSGRWDPEYLSTYQLIRSFLLPVRGEWIKNNLFIHGVIRTKVLKYCFSIFPGVLSQERYFLLLLALSGEWCYVDKPLYFRRANIGQQLRMERNDPVHRAQLSILSPVHGLYQMLIGVYRIEKVRPSIKLTILPIIFANALYSYYPILQEHLNIILHKTYGVAKNIFPEKTFLVIKNIWHGILK